MEKTGGNKRAIGVRLAKIVGLLVVICFSWEAANQYAHVQRYHMYRIQDMVVTSVAENIPRPADAQAIGSTIDFCQDIPRAIVATCGFFVTAEDIAGRESERSNIVFCNEQWCIDKYLKPGQVTGIRKVTGIHLEPGPHDGP